MTKTEFDKHRFYKGELFTASGIEVPMKLIAVSFKHGQVHLTTDGGHVLVRSYHDIEPVKAMEPKNELVKEVDMSDELDWKAAEEHLKECEEAYAETGSTGLFAMALVISPTRDRFNKGERTPDLYDDIFGIAL